jgi:hypothetical protein
MATYLHDQIVKAKAEKIVGKYVEIFSEEKYPLTKAANSIVVPSVEAINHYINTIFKVARLSAEAGIMCIVSKLLYCLIPLDLYGACSAEDNVAAYSRQLEKNIPDLFNACI